MDLGLNHGLGQIQLLEYLSGLFGFGGDRSARGLDAVFGQQLLGLVFVQVHNQFIKFLEFVESAELPDPKNLITLQTYKRRVKYYGYYFIYGRTQISVSDGMVSWVIETSEIKIRLIFFLSFRNSSTPAIGKSNTSVL